MTNSKITGKTLNPNPEHRSDGSELIPAEIPTNDPNLLILPLKRATLKMMKVCSITLRSSLISTPRNIPQPDNKNDIFS